MKATIKQLPSGIYYISRRGLGILGDKIEEDVCEWRIYYKDKIIAILTKRFWKLKWKKED